MYCCKAKMCVANAQKIHIAWDPPPPPLTG